MLTSDVIIVGGGVIGLSVAYSLAQSGLPVTIIDSGACGQASAAAAGMLAPLAESSKPTPLVPLTIQSLEIWPEFVDGLQKRVPTNLAIHGPGMLRVARDDNEERDLVNALKWQQDVGLPLVRLTKTQVQQIEPHISSDIQCATLSPKEKHVEPRELLAALLAACKGLGVKVLANTKVTRLNYSGSRIVSVTTDHSKVDGDQFIVCGGAWSVNLLSEIGCILPITPMKGQIAELAPINPPPISHTIYAHSGYLVPRSNGRIAAGATEERVGFDPEITPIGIESQRLMAANLVPLLSEARCERGWAGLRPVSVDGAPIIDRVPNWDNLIVAAGHGRNGILLTPLTGTIVMKHLAHKSDFPAAFSIDRFTRN